MTASTVPCRGGPAAPAASTSAPAPRSAPLARARRAARPYSLAPPARAVASDAGAKASTWSVVADIMTRGTASSAAGPDVTETLVTAHPDMPVWDALDLLTAHRVSGLPVVDPDTGRVVGVVSDFDLIAVYR